MTTMTEMTTLMMVMTTKMIPMEVMLIEIVIKDSFTIDLI